MVSCLPMMATDSSHTHTMLEFNDEFVLNRALVEHCIHRIKSRCKQMQEEVFDEERLTGS